MNFNSDFEVNLEKLSTALESLNVQTDDKERLKNINEKLQELETQIKSIVLEDLNTPTKKEQLQDIKKIF